MNDFFGDMLSVVLGLLLGLLALITYLTLAGEGDPNPITYLRNLPVWEGR